jgi:hypothetical protein
MANLRDENPLKANGGAAFVNALPEPRRLINAHKVKILCALTRAARHHPSVRSTNVRS